MLVTLGLALIFGILANTLITVPSIHNSVVGLQKLSSETEQNLAQEYIELYITNRVSALRDVTNFPVVKSGVMGSGRSTEDLHDFMRETTILGKRESIALINVASEPVYLSDRSFTNFDFSGSSWFSRLIEGESKLEVNLFVKDGHTFIQLAVPVALDGYVEGILLANFKVDLKNIISFYSSDERALSLSKNGVTLTGNSTLFNAPHTLTLTSTIEKFGIDVGYLINTEYFSNQKNFFVWRVTASIILTFGLTFLVLLITGNKMIIAPYKKLQTTIEERNKAMAIAEESSRIKSEFLASMSHEIRTPINGVLGMLRLLLRSDLTKQQVNYTRLAKSSADSLLGLINDILDFSKVEAGKLELENLDFDVKSLLIDFTQAFSYRAEEKGIRLILNIDHLDAMPVKGDPGRLRQILTNLVGNAIKFTEHGEVILRAKLIRKSNEQLDLLCEVEDTGPGINEDKLHLLFDSFRQVDASTTRKYGGTGLGLAIVKQLCELMGGSVSVSSALNSGSVFTFCIELQNSTLTASELEVLSSNKELGQFSQRSADSNLSTTRVLLVEDNSINQEVAKGLLEGFGLKADTANNGIEAIHVISHASLSAPYTLIFMDCQMPEMDGFEATRAIREGKAGVNNKNIPVIALTANAMKGDRDKCIAAGMDDYISKPIDPKLLGEKLHKWGAKERTLNTTSEIIKTPSVDAGNHPIWDENALLKRVRGKPERVHKLVGMFLQEMPSKIDALKQAAEQQDSARISDIAHSVKGSAGNLSCMRLQAAALALEQSAFGNKSLTELILKIEIEYRLFITEFNAFDAKSQRDQ